MELSKLGIYNGETLPTRSERMPAKRLDELLSNPKALDGFHSAFVIKWYMTYHHMSVPKELRYDMTPEVGRGDLIPYANRLIQKYPGITQDVIWEAWDIGIERYKVDNGATAFPMFNIAVLHFFINKYRHQAQMRLHPEECSEESRKIDPVLPTPRELLSAIRKMEPNELDLMLELQSVAYQPLFDHLATKMKTEHADKYKALLDYAKLEWCKLIGAKMGIEATGLMKLSTKEIIEKWDARFNAEAKSIDGICPSPWTQWRKCLLAEAEVWV